MDSESPAAPRRNPTVSFAIFHVKEPLRRMACGLRHLGSPYQRYRHARALHGLRVALAMLTTVLLLRALNLPHGIWAAVSMMTVIGGIQHHGNIRKKAAERALGTMLGAAAGLFVILLNDYVAVPAVTYAALSLIAGICAYYAIGRGGYIALLTAITMIIVGGQGDPLETGLWRTLNVCIGICVALAYSFALPLNASYSWRYTLALNLRRVASLIRRLQTDETVSMETRAATFADLSKRSIELRGLMPSVAKEMNVPGKRMEDIQHHQRAIIASMELICSAHMDADDVDQCALSMTFRSREACSMRASLLMMARALRAGDTAVLDEDALQARRGDGGKSQVPQLVREGIATANMPRGAAASHSAMQGADGAAGVMPEQSGPQGPDWVMRQTTQQIDQLRRVLSTLPRLPT
jgi:uncharacterized membrane protein YccC